MRPTWFRFFNYENSFLDEDNFLFGENILVVPKTTLSKDYYEIKSYWIENRLYNLITYKEVDIAGKYQLDHNSIGVFYIGGTITPLSILNGYNQLNDFIII